MRFHYPYVEHESLEIEPHLYEKVVDLNRRLEAALNQRTPMTELASLILTTALLEPYLEERKKAYGEELTDQDVEDERVIANQAIEYSTDLWSRALMESETHDLFFEVVDFGLHIDETSYYVMLDFAVAPSPDPLPFPYLAEFIAGELLVTGLGLVPFVFSY